MSNSKEYTQMCENIEFLKTQFCTEEVLKNEGEDTPQLLFSAYCLLVHAEFESFIETKIINRLDDDLAAYRSSKTVTNALAACATFDSDSGGPSQTVHSLSKTLSTAINSSVLNLKTYIEKKNHGIKQDNVVPLLIRIGVDISDIDKLLFDAMDKFGEDRGKIAHHGKGIRELINFNDEKDRINKVINLFKILDERI